MISIFYFRFGTYDLLAIIIFEQNIVKYIDIQTIMIMLDNLKMLILIQPVIEIFI